ncbi:hypothetical protein GCM10010495_79980 [Kitasatospora herbaricolor]|nr:hypothetical protein GCM10010495_79980 [Kitasatospora herbaricolor]
MVPELLLIGGTPSTAVPASKIARGAGLTAYGVHRRRRIGRPPARVARAGRCVPVRTAAGLAVLLQPCSCPSGRTAGASANPSPRTASTKGRP